MTASIARRELSTFVNRPFGWIPIPTQDDMQRWNWRANGYRLVCDDDGVFYIGRKTHVNGLSLYDEQGVQMAIDFIKQVKAWRRDNPCGL